MNQKTLSIGFPQQRGPQEPVGYHHRVKNFAEDLYREIELAGYGTITIDIDEYFKWLPIRILKRNQVASVHDRIMQIARKHFLDTELIVQIK